MALYRVRPNRKHGAHDEFGPGAVLELTEAEAAGFLDKLELVSEPAAAGNVVVVETPDEVLPTVDEESAAPVVERKRRK